jgi:hypothetical protein
MQIVAFVSAPGSHRYASKSAELGKMTVYIEKMTVSMAKNVSFREIDSLHGNIYRERAVAMEKTTVFTWKASGRGKLQAPWINDSLLEMTVSIGTTAVAWVKWQSLSGKKTNSTGKITILFSPAHTGVLEKVQNRS